MLCCVGGALFYPILYLAAQRKGVVITVYKYESEIEAVLNKSVRPLLRAHGGDMQVLSFEDGVVRFKLLGRCAGCAAADITSEELIHTELTNALPQVKQAVLVNEISRSLMDQAAAILKMRHET